MLHNFEIRKVKVSQILKLDRKKAHFLNVDTIKFKTSKF